MASVPNLPEDTVIYKLFCITNDGNSNISTRDSLEISAENYLSRLSGFLRRYVWQNDCFNLHFVDDNTPGTPPHLEGITNFEENIEDEWFIVYLLFYLSERDKNLVIQVQDNFGEFLLVQAAEHLPKWITPDSSENRVFIYQGALHIIPKTCISLDSTPTLINALEVLRQKSSKTLASEAIQKEVKKKIDDYPQKIDQLKHRAHCYVPYTVAAIIKEDPHLLPHAVKAFFLRDPIDLQACRAMRFFAPETRVMTEVYFTKFLYAQLTRQKYEPDKIIGWNMPDTKSPQWKAYDLGMKLACGFEILASNVEKMMQVEKKDHDFTDDARWKRFTKSLKDRGYFRDEVEGSNMYTSLLRQAQEFYLGSLRRHDTNGNAEPGIRVRRLLQTLSDNYEEMKEAEKNLRPPDDDSWLNISPDGLDAILEQWSGQKSSSEKEVGEAITTGLTSFLQSRSDLEGVEPPQRPPRRNKKQKIDFNPDAFADAMNAILDFRIPNASDDDASSSSMSGYSDDDDDDVSLGEGNREKYNQGSKNGKLITDMKDYMDSMDRELAQTSIGLSFEKLPPQATLDDEEAHQSDINDEEDGFQPVDVNLTALKNILESYSSQQGLPGPVSNLFASMGMNMPENADS